MDTSSRPRIGSFVAGDEKHNYFNGSIGFGYQFDNGWRTEGEYTFKKKSEYTSGSSRFPTSFNHMKTDTQRIMFNVYRDFKITNEFSVYANAGLGIARIKTGGWQRLPENQFGENTNTNLIYSFGVGGSYTPVDNLVFDLGFRFVDLGKVESGMNNFVNFASLQDEQMKGHLYSREVYFGVRYIF